MTGQHFDWTWYIIVYFFLGGVAAGAYFTAALADLFGGPSHREMAKVGYYIALPLIVICGILLIVDLGRPDLFWELIAHPDPSSPIGWSPTFKLMSPIQVGGFALTAFGFFAALSLADVWVEEGRLKVAPLRQFYSAVPRRVYAGIGVLFGFFVASYTGVLLTTTAQEYWSSLFTGALFLASAASTGAASIGLVLAMINRADTHEAAERLTRMDNVMIVLEIVALVLVLATASGLAGAFFTGAMAVPFWLFVVIGIVVPLAMQFRVSFGGAHLPPAQIIVASLLVLAGGFVMRYAVLMVAQS